MSEPEVSRPRRALAADDPSDHDDAIAPDDTPGASAHGARRGSAALPDPDEAAGTARPQRSASHPGDDADPAPDDSTLNPFARPGSEAATEPIEPAPTPVLPTGAAEESETLPASAGSAGRRSAGWSEDPGPAPRRSALSATSPTEDVLVPAPASGARSGAAAQPTWFQHYRKAIIVWVVGALVAALAIVGGLYAYRLSTTAQPTPSPSPAPTPTGSDTSSPPPDLRAADLIEVEDAALIVPGSSWAVTGTVTDKTQQKARAACLSADLGEVNPLQTFQRTLGTSQKDKLAALHQVDIYASEAAAKQVQASRAQNLASCDEVPARIISSVDVSALGDQAVELVVAYENKPVEYHDVLLVRNGRALTILDVVRNDKPVPGVDAAKGLMRSLGQVCRSAEGTCPAAPTGKPLPPPATKPPGWLVPADLPRLTPGTGRWTATAPGQLTSNGMGCENLTLATVQGPLERAQATYLLTQDPAAPQAFGLDMMTFNFDTPQTAAGFVKTLGDNLAGCKQRMLNATVTEHPGAAGQSGDGTPISTRLFTIKQATSDKDFVLYQLVVGVTGSTVYYGLATVTDKYQFSEQQLKEIGLRQGQRSAQVPK